MSADLYEILGLDRDATTAQIKSTYRKLVKTVHPDAGGGVEDFQQLQRAHDVLTDASKRARYDADGTIDDRADSQEANAINLVLGAFDSVLQMCIGAGKEPATVALIAAMDGNLQQQLAGHRVAKANAENLVAKLVSVSKRFKTKKKKPNRIKLFTEQKIEHLRGVIGNAENLIQMTTRAIEMLDDYDFDVIMEEKPRLDPSALMQQAMGPNPRYTFK